MEENKAGKGVREYWVGAKQVIILSRPIRKSLTQNVVIKPKCERDEGSSNINIWKKKIIGWVNSMCKCPEVEMCLAVSVAGMEVNEGKNMRLAK